MTEDQAKEFKNLLRYQCKALDAIKMDAGQQSERLEFILEDSRLERTTLEIIRTHTRSLALNLRGIMVLIRIVFWLIGLQFAGGGVFAIVASLNADGEVAQGTLLVVGVILIGIAGFIVHRAEKVFGEEGGASTPLK